MVDVDPRLASRFRSFSRTASLLAALSKPVRRSSLYETLVQRPGNGDSMKR
jgi:hypothetical protein